MFYFQKSTAERSEYVYNVLRQPISVETISVYDITNAEAASAGMRNAFVVAQRNTLQQVFSIITLQAHTSLGKEKWMSTIREASEQATNPSHHSLARNESIKQLLSLDSDRQNLLKNSRVLELPNNTVSPRYTTLKRINSNYEYMSTSSRRMVESTQARQSPNIMARSSSSGLLMNDSRMRASSASRQQSDEEIEEVDELETQSVSQENCYSDGVFD